MPYQYGNEANPRAHYETHRPRDPARPAGDRRLRRRPRHGRHADRHRPLPQGAQARRARSSRRRRTPATSCRACAASKRASSRPCSTRRVLDGKIVVDSRSSFAATKELTHKEGIFAGISGGAVVRTAQRVAERLRASEHRHAVRRRRLEVPQHATSGRRTTKTCQRTSKTRSGGERRAIIAEHRIQLNEQYRHAVSRESRRNINGGRLSQLVRQTNLR